ncbi:MAG TPA: glycosyl hydrolase [Candidatus Limnocylindria bacterium]
MGYTTLALGAGGKSSDRAITSNSKASNDADEITRASLEWSASRIAPGTEVPAGAFLNAYTQASALPVTGGTWSEVTSQPYDSDAHGYRDPTFSNSGGGSGLVSGRMTALAIQGSTVWAGGADGGVWKSTDGGTSWTPTFDSMPGLSVGAISVDPANDSVWVGTGEANTNADSYRGTGVYVTTDGSSWTHVGDGSAEDLDATTIARLAFDGNGHVFAASSKGLFKHSTTDLTAAWTKVFDAAKFGYTPRPYGLSLVNDVVVRPGTNGQYIVANMSWRNGAAYDGFYVSTDGGNTFAQVKAGGAIVDNDIGSTTFAYSADGSTLYAVVESPFQIQHFTQSGGTTLQGVFVSPTGDAAGPWNKIAEGRKLATSGSALANYFRGYNPGVQSWYNRFLAVDPANKNHVYLGLEEVFETQDGGNSWFAIGPYWNFGLPCSKNGLDSCPKTTHPDQHAIAIANGTVYVGNDGGVWSRSTGVHTVDGWNDLNATLHTLQYYFAGSGSVTGGDAIWGGLQDNGESLVAPGLSTMVSPFGGDGGDTLVDPNDGNRAVVEYTDLDMALTTNGGQSNGTANAFTEITPSCFAFTYTPNPCDPSPRFIAPFRADIANINHWVAGGRYLWDNQSEGWDTHCSSTSCTWQIVADTGAGHSTTSIAVSGTTIYAGWCGACNPRETAAPGSSTGFNRGIVTNAGGTWHQLDLSSATTGLPNRFVNAIAIDPANASHIYAAMGGFSRNWIANAGTGHVFESTNGGTTWTDISGTLPDAPMDDIIVKGSSLYVSSDVGVFTATKSGSAWTWSQFGSGLPKAVAADLHLSSDGNTLRVATHGRGIWQLALP